MPVLNWNLSTSYYENEINGTKMNVLAFNWVVPILAGDILTEDLLYYVSPWKWEDITWQLYNVDRNLVGEELTPILLNDGTDIETLIKEQLNDSLKEHKSDAFSLDSKLALAKNGKPPSIPHILAGLNRKPVALIGQNSLRMCGHFILDDSIGNDNLVLFPSSLKVNNYRVLKSDISTLSANANGTFKVKYQGNGEDSVAFSVTSNLINNITTNEVNAKTQRLSTDFYNWCGLNLCVSKLTIDHLENTRSKGGSGVDTIKNAYEFSLQVAVRTIKNAFTSVNAETALDYEHFMASRVFGDQFDSSEKEELAVKFDKLEKKFRNGLLKELELDINKENALSNIFPKQWGLIIKEIKELSDENKIEIEARLAILSSDLLTLIDGTNEKLMLETNQFWVGVIRLVYGEEIRKITKNVNERLDLLTTFIRHKQLDIGDNKFLETIEEDGNKKFISFIDTRITKAFDGLQFNGANVAIDKNQVDHIKRSIKTFNSTEIQNQRLKTDKGIPILLSGSFAPSESKGRIIAVRSYIGVKGFQTNWITSAKTCASGEAVGHGLQVPMPADKNNGRSLSIQNYTGEPLTAVDKDKVNGCKLVFIKDESEIMPVLGFGLTYKQIAVDLDHAGGAFDPRFLTNIDKPTEVIKNAGGLPWDDVSKSYTFLSVEPISSATLEFADDTNVDPYELSDDTFAKHWQKIKGEEIQNRVNAGEKGLDVSKNSPVACLTPENPRTFKGGRSEYKLNITLPTASALYIERWLNYDLANLELGLNLGDGRLDSRYQNNYIALREKLCTERKNRKSNSSSNYQHPAIGKIRLRLKVIDGQTKPEPKIIEENVNYLEGISGNTITPVNVNNDKVKITVESGSDFEIDGSRVTIKRGQFAKLYIDIGINKDFIEHDTKKRLDDYLLDYDSHGWVGEKDGYHFFRSSAYWFEALEEFDESYASEISEIEHENSDNVTTLNLLNELKGSSLNIFTKKTKALLINQHEWHWSGMPLGEDGILTSENEKEYNWLADYANTASVTNEFTKELMLSDPTNWTVGDDDRILETAYLSKFRGAQHRAYTIRPIARFGKWLNPKIKNEIENTVFVKGKTINGRVIERPNPPIWKHAIPLTQTFSPEKFGVSDVSAEKQNNGVACLFDEALYKTGDRVQGGGIAEVLDFDVLSARVYYGEVEPDVTKHIAEYGSNPIFHNSSEEKLASTFLTVQTPTGLVNEKGTNPLVVSTKVIVQPAEGCEGEWLLAKTRVRKFYWPHLLVDNDYSKTDDSSQDKAIYCKYDIDLQLKFGDVELATSLGELLEGKEVEYLRILLTRHKESWDLKDPLPTWRIQVVIYGAKSEHEEYTPVLKIPASDMGRFGEEPGKLKATINVEKEYILLSSDYTEAKWLSFIGQIHKGQLSKSTNSIRMELKDNKLVPVAVHDGTQLDWPLNSRICESATTFQMLLVYRVQRDALRGYVDSDVGMPIGLYDPKFEANEATGKLHFEGGFNFSDGEAPKIESMNDSEYFAYILNFQRHHTQKIKSRVLRPRNWTELFEAMFPSKNKFDEDSDKLVESTIRLLPSFEGPIPIINKAGE